MARMNTKKVFFRGALLVGLSFILSGCVQVTQTLTISEEGEVDMVHVRDYTEMYAMMEGNDGEIENPCDEASEEEGLTFLSCSMDDGGNIMTLRKEGQLGEDMFEAKNGYFLVSMPLHLEAASQDEMSDPEGIKMFADAGMKFDYKLIFPGEIVSANYGDTDGNELSYEVFEAIEQGLDVMTAIEVIVKSENASGSVPWDVPEKIAVGTSDDELYREMTREISSGLSELLREEAADIEHEGTPDVPQIELPSTGSTSIFGRAWEWLIGLF